MLQCEPCLYLDIYSFLYTYSNGWFNLTNPLYFAQCGIEPIDNGFTT